MPELVDVEGFRRVLAQHAAGRRVIDVDVRDSGVLHGTSAGALRHDLPAHQGGRPGHSVVPVLSAGAVTGHDCQAAGPGNPRHATTGGPVPASPVSRSAG